MIQHICLQLTENIVVICAARKKDIRLSKFFSLLTQYGKMFSTDISTIEGRHKDGLSVTKIVDSLDS